jgi:hypothetical protein
MYEFWLAGLSIRKTISYFGLQHTADFSDLLRRRKMKKKNLGGTRIFPQHPGQCVASDPFDAGRYSIDEWPSGVRPFHQVQFTAAAGFNDGARWHVSHNPAMPQHTLCGMPRRGQGATRRDVAKYRYGHLRDITCGDCARVINFCQMLLVEGWPSKFVKPPRADANDCET